MLYWIYVVIAVFLATIVLIELFTEKDWKKQVTLSMVLMVLVLRILQIK